MVAVKINRHKIENFPIYSYGTSLCETLKNSPGHTMILTAETGAGKSTVFPTALLEHFKGNIIMTQPRRISVLGTSSRISDILEEPEGTTCGYRIHLESKVSQNTRLEVVTEAVLLRMLQEDFALEKYNVVVLDEFHERSATLDLISAFLKEALAVRDDLYIVVMSATINAKKTAAWFNDAPIQEIPGRTYPVEIEYQNDMSTETAVIREYNQSQQGNILVFLPGLSEIKKCIQSLEEKFSGVEKAEILCLHSSISIEEQKKILTPQKDRRRIIVSSAIAESSVTVPDIISVIDSGLCRTKIFDASTGMEKLVTISESEFSADQRAGRAGRTQKGRCIRLWSKSDVRQKEIVPEILRSELSSIILECAERGETRLEKIDFLDKPQKNLWEDSLLFLKQSGMLNKENNITKKGSCALKLAMNIRLSGIVLSGWKKPELMEYAKELFFKYGSYSEISYALKEKTWNDVLRRLEKCNWQNEESVTDKKMLLLQGFADRLAKRISENGSEKTEYQFTSGRKAVLHNSFKCNSLWIVAPEADAGKSNAVIFGAEEISGKEFEEWIQKHSESRTECNFENGRIQKKQLTCLGRVVLNSKKLETSDEDIIPAWKNLVRQKGIDELPLDDKCKNFLLRVQFYRQQKNLNTDINETLTEELDQWLVPFMGGIKKLDSATVYNALYWYLEGSTIDKEVPEFLEFSNGKKFKVIYEKNIEIKPVVEVIIQRIFGCFATPKIMGHNVLLKLLSPARRPLQITEDLENFWSTSWNEICKEMKGRYPKHNWDYRISED